ncbi:hypothetical protein Pla110_44390 [Polystyrenella longa]|uniref:Uncharacterized protein n=1 Tax=Polystyrenella longa TaxID=2528007 RepID=A0A518CU01_9PLAN|nr:hypothetical protein [Polystyrenella longa]QDU82678.1 hypothetical protein Pla110_44390 [Polystyrenella longa]
MTISRLDLVEFPGPVYVKQITNQDWSSGIQSMMGYSGGSIVPTFGAHEMQIPEVTFTTTQLATLLGFTGPRGVAFASAVNTYQKLAGTVGNVARLTASHQRAQMTAGLVYLRSLELNNQNSGTAEVAIVSVYDGSNDPIVITGSVALPTSIEDTEHFRSGPVYINGSSVADVTRVRYETGIEIYTQNDGDSIWPDLIAIEKFEPTITIESTAVSAFAGTGIDGLALNGSTGVIAYGRKRTNNQAGGVAFVSGATGQHISLAGLNGRYFVSDLSGNGATPINTSIRCELTGTDDEDSIVTVSTTATLP